MCCKMKRIIFILYTIITIAGANAASMCIPNASNLTTTGKCNSDSCNTTGNRGTWWIYPNGTSANTDYLVRGEGHCSASSVYPADDFETFGKRCWCRITGIISSNGYRAPRNGAWTIVYLDDYNQCTTTCWTYCANTIKNNPAFRRVAFASSLDN